MAPQQWGFVLRSLETGSRPGRSIADAIAHKDRVNKALQLLRRNNNGAFADEGDSIILLAQVRVLLSEELSARVYDLLDIVETAIRYWEPLTTWSLTSMGSWLRARRQKFTVSLETLVQVRTQLLAFTARHAHLVKLLELRTDLGEVKTILHSIAVAVLPVYSALGRRDLETLTLLDIQTADPSEDLSELYENEARFLGSFESDSMCTLRYLLPPGFMQRRVARLSLGVSALCTSSYFLYSRSHVGGSPDLEDWIVTASRSVRAYGQKHLWDPLARIYTEVFLSGHKISADAESMLSARNSLERMLTDFVKNKYGPGPELDSALRAASQGDIDIVMRVYEAQMQKPLMNVVQGELMQCLLIQVQKLKVSMEDQLMAVNDLIRSNETNVQLLAIIPFALGVSLVFYGAGGIYRLWRRRRSLDFVSVERRMLIILRQLERYYAKTGSKPSVHLMDFAPAIHLHTSSSLADLAEQGEQEAKLWRVSRFLEELTLPNHVRTMLLDDIDDLRSHRYSAEQKAHLIGSIRSTYRFLLVY